MKKLLLILSTISFFGCADQVKRQKHLQSLYPKCKVEPATGLLQQQGGDFIVLDSANQIICVSFYPFSETKIQSLRNIR